MFTLSPGPSRLSDETKNDIHRAIETGVLELSHRSTRFTEISKDCIEELRAYLGVPREYRIFYFDSSTHVWHSMVANLVKKTSFHFVNGAFSGKAREASRLLYKEALGVEVPWGEQCDFARTKIPTRAELITACFNETSNGVKMTDSDVRELGKKNPKAMLAIDITSSAGSVPNRLRDADIWYFSVQKGFGLPAGLGIAIVSPRAYERSVALSDKRLNNSGIWAWEKLEEMMADGLHQTPHTPNVLNIYLLGEQCKRWNKDGGLEKRTRATLRKRKLYESWMSRMKKCSHFVKDEKHRSDTVFVIQAAEKDIKEAKEYLLKRGIELGGGYGKIKTETFRIANFPAVSEEIMKKSLDLLADVFDH